MAVEVKEVRVDSFELLGKRASLSVRFRDGSIKSFVTTNNGEVEGSYEQIKNIAVRASRDFNVPLLEIDHEQMSLVKQAKGILEESNN
jgi:hypothetical protein